MARFKKGDKVVLSEKFYLDCPSTEMTLWVDKLKVKNREAGYLIITDVVRDDTYRYRNDYEGIDAYLSDDWLEPYIDFEPSPSCMDALHRRPLMLLPEDELSVRDRFAMAALMCFRADLFTAPEYVAEKAYKVADAMMEARKI